MLSASCTFLISNHKIKCSLLFLIIAGQQREGKQQGWGQAAYLRTSRVSFGSKILMSWASDRSFHIKTSACKVLQFLIFSYGHQQWVASWSRVQRLKNSRFFWFRDLSISNHILCVVAANYIDFSLLFLPILLSVCVLASKSSVCGKTQSTMKQICRTETIKRFWWAKIVPWFTTKGQKNGLQEAAPAAPAAGVVLWNPALNSASQVCVTIIPNCYSILLICISSPTTTTTNYLFFRKILSFLCMMKSEWASLSYDLNVCILTFFISKEEDTSLTATWRDRVNQDPPEEPLSTGCYYDSVVDEHQMSWYLVPSYHPFFMVSLWVAG